MDKKEIFEKLKLCPYFCNGKCAGTKDYDAVSCKGEIEHCSEGDLDSKYFTNLKKLIEDETKKSLEQYREGFEITFYNYIQSKPDKKYLEGERAAIDFYSKLYDRLK